MFSRQELASGFRSLGIVPGDIVMVHASVRSVGEAAGGFLISARPLLDCALEMMKRVSHEGS